MVFGEILEPTTRALCDDELVDYPENEDCNLTWTEHTSIPTITKLFIINTAPLLSIFKKCILGDLKPISEIQPAKVKLYEIQTIHIITCEDTNIIVGNVMEKMIPWITSSTEVIVLTSGSVLQNSTESAPCVIRSLFNNTMNVCPKLEVPNLVTGMAASVFTYCTHINKSCNLLVVFFDEVPLDSINTRPLLNLIETLGLNLLRSYEFQEVLPYNNLYI